MALPRRIERHLDHGAGARVDRGVPEQAVALEQYQGRALVRRRERGADRGAFGVGRLVERDLDLVGACFLAAVVVPAPAGLEGQAHGQAGLGVGDLEAVDTPFHGRIDARARAGGHGQRAFLYRLRVGHEVAAPALVVDPGPGVVAALAHQLDRQRLRAEQVARRIGAHHLEAGAVVGRRTVGEVEQRAHADQRVCRPDRALQVARHGAAAGLEHAALHDDLHRAGDGRAGQHVERLLQAAVVVQRGIDRVLRVLRQFEQRVAEVEVGQGGDRVLVARDGELGSESVAGGRRAEQVGGLDRQREILAGREALLFAPEVQLEAFGEEFLDAEAECVVGGALLRVGGEVHRPASGWCVERDLAREFVGAELARLQLLLQHHATIRLAQGGEQWLRRQRTAVSVAQQRGHADGLAGTVEVTAGPGEDFGVALRAAGDAELGQVQRGLVEGEEGQVAAPGGDQQLGAVQPRGELRQPLAVGFGLADLGAVGAAQRQRHRGQRFAGLERGRMHQQAVAVGAHVQADVGHEEHRRVVGVGEGARALHHREIQTRCLEFVDVAHRQVGQGARVGVGRDRESVGVDGFRQLRERLDGPGPAAALRLPAGDEPRYSAVAHAQELDVDLGRVDGHDRQPAAFVRRQHHSLAREAEQWLQRAGVDLVPGFRAQGRAVGRRQRRADRHHVGLVGLEVGEAQPHAVGVERPGAIGRGAILESDREQLVELLRSRETAGKGEQRGRAAVLRLRGRSEQTKVPRCVVRGGGALQRRHRHRLGGRSRAGRQQDGEQQRQHGIRSVHGGLPVGLRAV